MIVFIEGPRETGKTYLLESFFAKNQNPNIVYYKFAFAKYIEELGFRDQETGPGVHYFSIANVLTILELNKTLLKDKLLVFDRSIFSAYVWSIYRNRMDRTRLINEFEKVLQSSLYEDCVLMYMTRKEEPNLKKREKDYFGNFENYEAERAVFEKVLAMSEKYDSDSSRKNYRVLFSNHFDADSVDVFGKLLDDLARSVASR